MSINHSFFPERTPTSMLDSSFYGSQTTCWLTSFILYFLSLLRELISVHSRFTILCTTGECTRIKSGIWLVKLWSPITHACWLFGYILNLFFMQNYRVCLVMKGMETRHLRGKDGRETHSFISGWPNRICWWLSTTFDWVLVSQRNHSRRF